MIEDRATVKVYMTAAQYREFAEDYKARSKEAGISQKRATLLANLARSFSGIASQLEMLAADVAEENRK